MNKFVRLFGGFAIVGLSVTFGWSSGVCLCDWLDSGFEAGRDCFVCKETVTPARGLPTQITDVFRPKGVVARPSATPGRTGGRGWIADVWSGPRRTRAFKVAGISKNGEIDTRSIESDGARHGFGETVRQALRKRGKAPLRERSARRAKDPFDTQEARGRSDGSGEEEAKQGPLIYEGDVYISGLPMIDQGPMAYCAVASTARVLQGYGVDVSMDDMAVLAGSSPTGGTNPLLWEDAIRSVAQEHGLTLHVIPELTETMTPLSYLVNDYNYTAREMGYTELNTWDYASRGKSDYLSFDNDRSYDVQREVMLSDSRKQDAFDKNVRERIDDSDPLFWTVLLGDVAESSGTAAASSDERSAHMRLIIGYNEERGEVLYSDSWGAGHELKRMDAADALSITTALSYLK